MKKKIKEKTELEKEIECVEKSLRNLEDTSSQEYESGLKTLERLEKIQSDRLSREKPKRKVDPNTVLSIAGELVSMGLIMGYERLHVLSTKAFSRIWRPKI